MKTARAQAAALSARADGGFGKQLPRPICRTAPGRRLRLQAQRVEIEGSRIRLLQIRRFQIQRFQIKRVKIGVLRLRLGCRDRRCQT